MTKIMNYDGDNEHIESGDKIYAKRPVLGPQRRRKIGISKKITDKLTMVDGERSESSMSSISTRSQVDETMQPEQVLANGGSRHFGDEIRRMSNFDGKAEATARSDEFPTTSSVYFANDVQTLFSAKTPAYFKDNFRTASVPTIFRQRSTSYDLQNNALDSHLNDSALVKTSSLQRIPIEEARAKTFLLSRRDFINDNELEKLLPDKTLLIYIASWNLAGKEVPIDALQDWILAENFPHAADMYAIGVQEAPNNSGDFSEWEAKLQQCLLPCRQVVFHSVWLGVQHLVIFVRRELIWFLSRVDDFRLSTRAMTNVRTKGAVSIAFKLFGTSFLFISSHLAYGADPAVRVKDYHRIVKSLYLKNFSLTADDVLTKINFVFWFGDLNFRLDEQRIVIENFINSVSSPSSLNFDVLLQNDQLIRERNADRVFGGFSEAQIKFVPTYKYDIGTNNFDTSAKNRVPAYTDRILYRNNTSDKGSLRNLAYSSVLDLCFSDHKPVLGLFLVALKPGRDNLPASKFNAKIYHKGVINAAKSSALEAQRTRSALCSIM